MALILSQHPVGDDAATSNFKRWAHMRRLFTDV